MLFGISYIALSLYYRNCFTPNTWINGVYCTGKTVEDINESLLSGTEAACFTIWDESGNSYTVRPEDIGYQADYQEALRTYQREQITFLWMFELTERKEPEIFPLYTWNQEQLEALVDNLPFVKEEETRPRELRIQYEEETGFTLYNGLLHRLNREMLLEGLKLALYRGETEILIDDLACYEDIPEDEAMQEIHQRWNQLEAFTDTGIIYDMGTEQISLSGSISASFVMRDDDGQPMFDEKMSPVICEEAVLEFIDALADEYDTLGQERSRQSTCGQTVTVTYKTYGTQLDRETEASWLLTALEKGIQGKHMPAYLSEGIVRGLDDIGDTYIEIDMTCQKLYFYINGECVVETDIVTGNVKRGMSTPAGVYYVYAKQRGRTLRGADYATYVNYWMPVNGNIGIHDATWRSAFGGDIYLTNGSHGCINVPKDKTKEIYEQVEIGIPVVMFYHELRS